jgi:ATP-binding cassette subfamily F protein 3
MSLVSATGLSVSYGAHDVFDGVSFEVPPRARIALIGPNGSGKTSLLRLIAGLERPAGDGRLARKRGLKIGYLPQVPHLDSDRTLHDEMRHVFGELDAAAAELRQLEAQMAESAGADDVVIRYDRLQAAFEEAGGYLIDHQIERVLSGLGFSTADYDRPLGQLSGGQQTRALLGRLLLESPDLLLLDEPTNHLDLAAIVWLESFFKDWHGGLVAVAHDREFLDGVAQHVWDLADGTLTAYRGNYTDYARQRAERAALQAKAYARQQAFIAKEEDFIRRNVAGQRTKEAQGRRTRLGRLERIEAPEAEKDTARVRLEVGRRGGDRVLLLDGLTVGYDRALPLVTCDELELHYRDRVALLGPNGAGKTTLLRTVLGNLEPLAGRAVLGGGVQVGYFSQTHDRLDDALSVLDHVVGSGGMLEAEARSFLGRYQFSGDEVFKPVRTLSGGERARVALALLELDGANFLILDEPTNHLDIRSQEMLQEVLRGFAGTTLLVTHDRYLIRALDGQVWAIEDGELLHFVDGYDEYRAWLDGGRARSGSQPKDERREAYETEKRATRREERDRRRRVERLETLESEIRALERTIDEIHAALEDASTHQDVDEVARLGDEYARSQHVLQALMDEWLALEESGSPPG